MGKIRTRALGFEEVEKEQKEDQKKRAAEKKVLKKKEKKQEAKETKVEKEPAVKKARQKPAVAKKPKGKKYQKAKAKVDSKKAYSVEAAIALLKKITYVTFDESVELHLNVLEAGLKGEVSLPHSTGKTVRVKIVDDQVLTNLEKNIINFDVLIAHPTFMPKIAKYARILGPKGLMPNPKAGTVSPNPQEVAEKFTKGALRWKTEVKFPLIHQMVGKISANQKALVENVQAFLTSVGAKNIKNAVIKTTMSPGIKLHIEKA